jgi:general secretion pathway protein A
MYKQFFGLKRNPFEITPDPSFLFSTKKHNEALAVLYYGVRKHKGFVVLTGEVGTGKTLLLRCMLQLLKDSGIGYAYIFNSILSPVEFLQYVGGEFGLSWSGKNKSELLLLLGNHLIERQQRKLTTVLIIDEAHHLSPAVLEEVRLLTNLETPQDKLLQILLVGQPELDSKLDSFELRQLKQRIALRAELGALTFDETRGYVHSRLRQAGANANAERLFPIETLSAIHRHASGIPRLINTVCENALITAYARQDPWVTADIIEDVARDLRLGGASHSRAATSPPAWHKDELRSAISTLLEVRSKLRTRNVHSETADGFNAGVKHEPFI